MQVLMPSSANPAADRREAALFISQLLFVNILKSTLKINTHEHSNKTFNCLKPKLCNKFVLNFDYLKNLWTKWYQISAETFESSMNLGAYSGIFSN